MRKIIFAACVFLLAVTEAFALDFDVTPEGAALFRERGAVGYLYWGNYRDC